MAKKVRVKMVTPFGKERYFDSLQDAAKYEQINSWTMAIKMEAFGFFQGKDGSKYYREKKMNTKNEYTSSTPTMKIKMPKYKRKVKKTKKVKETFDPKPIDIKPNEQYKSEPVSILVNTKDPAIKAINDRIIKILVNANVYDEILALSEAIKKLSK